MTLTAASVGHGPAQSLWPLAQGAAGATAPLETLLAWDDGESVKPVDPGRAAPPYPSVHELGVPLCPSDDDIHPDAHGLGRGCHHVVEAVVGLDTEGERRVRALGRRMSMMGSALWHAPPSHPHKAQHRGPAVSTLSSWWHQGPQTTAGVPQAPAAPLPARQRVMQGDGSAGGSPAGTGAAAVPSSHLCSTAEVVIVNLFDGLEVDDTLQLGLMFICPRQESGEQRCGDGAGRGQRWGKGAQDSTGTHPRSRIGCASCGQRRTSASSKT